ncbi:hypothetical protein VSS74_29585 [Conexibacter stalactiti]|uniref:Uncharacterized protein n=1 Tax=Conexibacter stalactiti TaxID=1940611 RepID=A0ABU4I1E4_9ACTN|nr:hypothetical protein [Conexibacter stalactiti]MDW5598550.1 hypothetical protein [Conexibacter stalactiti]MEC5039192.1 hypothetical protein [Conexibacter stalactiti]
MSLLRSRADARGPSLLIALAVAVACLAVGTASATAHPGHAGHDGRIAGIPDLQRVGGETRRYDARNHRYVIERRGQPDTYYHADPPKSAAFASAWVTLPAQQLDPVCATSGNRIVPVWHHPAGEGTVAAPDLIRSVIRRMNWKINAQSSLTSGGQRLLRMRVACDSSGQILVREVVAPNTTDPNVVRTTVQGAQPPDGADAVKYAVFIEGENSEAGGYGYLRTDTRKTTYNDNRTYTTTGMTWREGWETHVPVHELVHTLGGSQPSAPLATAGFHCVDGLDVLCYQDARAGQPPVPYIETACPRNGSNETAVGVPLDCNNDTYFDALPEPGEWLDTNWNVGGAENPFLVEDPASPSTLTETLYDDGGGAGWGWRTYSLAAAAPQQPPVAGNPSAIALDGKSRVYSRSSSGHLTETLTDWLGGRVWNAYDLTADAGSWATIAGDPAPLVVDGQPRVYAVNAAGELLEFLYGTARWEAHNMTSAAGAPAIAGRPAVTMLNGYPRIYARTLAGALIEFVWSGQNGRSWEWYNLPSSTDTEKVAGDPSIVLVANNPHVYYRTTDGQLATTYYGPVGGGWGWSRSNLTAAVAGPSLAGDPAAFLIDGNPRIYTVSDSGILTETLRGTNSRGVVTWSWYDLSSPSGAPRLAPLRPAVVMHEGAPRVYSRTAGDRLIETMYGRDGSTWRWTSYDLTFHTRATLNSAPSAIIFGGGPRIYARG